MSMKTKVIDYIIKAIERKADEVGYAIDANPDYQRVCEIVTDFDELNKVPTFEEKKFCAETLERLCLGLSLRYDMLLALAIYKSEIGEQKEG